MTLEPLIQAPLVVQAHVVTVVPAFVLGVWLLLFSRKGSDWHRALGITFLALMVVTAFISLLIHRRTPDSAVFGMSSTHLFVPFVLVCCLAGDHRRIEGRHQATPTVGDGSLLRRARDKRREQHLLPARNHT